MGGYRRGPPAAGIPDVQEGQREGGQGAESGGEAPALEEEARVGVTGRLWLAGPRLDDLPGWGGPRCLRREPRGQGTGPSPYNALTHARTRTPTPTPAGTRDLAHSDPQVVRPCSHPAHPAREAPPGLAPGPHTTRKPASWAGSARAPGLSFLIWGMGMMLLFALSA